MAKIRNSSQNNIYGGGAIALLFPVAFVIYVIIRIFV